MKKFLWFMICCLISTSFAFAQTKTVQGVVVDEGGEPLIGVSVFVPGTSFGISTNADGEFQLSVPQSTTSISFKYIGMKDLVVPIKTGIMQITMISADNILEEVVISVAYGTQKRSALTGAVTSVGVKEIEQRPVTSVTTLLEGKMGIMVASENGQPGSSPSVRVRGFGSVYGDNSPLYVVDGFTFGGNISDLNPQDIAEISVLKDASSAAIYGNRGANGVILITTKHGNSEKPHVSLTMNQGFDSRSLPDYNRLGADQWMEASWIAYRNQILSTQNVSATPNKVSVAQANAQTNNEIIPVYLKYNIYNKPDNQLFDANGKLQGQIRDGYKDDLDWFDAGIRSGQRQEYIVSSDGKLSNKADYYFSAGYLDQQGYAKNAQFQRFSGRAKINVAPTKWFNMGFNITGTKQAVNNMDVDGGGYRNLFSNARGMSPIYPVHLHDMATGEYILDAAGNKRYDDGKLYGRPQQNGRQTIWENELNSDKSDRRTLLGNIFGEITFLKDFKFKIAGDLNARTSEADVYESAIIGDGSGNNARGGFTAYRYQNYSFLQQLTYTKTISNLFNFNVLAAHENYAYNYWYSYGRKADEKLPGLQIMSNFNSITSLDGYENNDRNESYFSRVQFNYDEKYYLDGSFRRDGTSRIYKDNRWGNFYSVGAAWNIAKEDFMQGIDQVNYLKLRANYGETGNDESLGYYDYMALYSISMKNGGKGAFYKNNLESLTMSWEAQTSFGVAVDGRVFDRFNFSLEYFDKRSRDLLFPVKKPESAGTVDNTEYNPTVWQNIGTVSNRGFELSLDADIIRTRNFNWHVGLNATALKNKILTLPDENKVAPYYGIIDGTKKYTEGHDMYDFWTYQYVGVDQMNGRALYKLNDNEYYIAKTGTTAPADETRIVVPAESNGHPNYVTINGVDYVYKPTYAKRDFSGSSIPKLMGSFSTGVNYKGIALDFVFTYAWGNKVMDNPYRDLMGVGGTSPSSLHADVLNSWNGVPDGITADSPNRISTSATPILDPTFSADVNNQSTRFLTDGSYLNFKNINLSYSLPKSWIKNLELEAVRVNVTAENLFLLSARQGLNSQMSFTGSISSYASTPRVISLGLKVDF
jgi:TonB-linked SusC/RagA family outer membrane protein